MVAHPAYRCAAAGRDSNFHGQFRHRLGTLSVSLIHAHAAKYPRRVGVLSHRRRAGD